MKYYWVNQGKTYKQEKKGGYLWAPLKNIKGKPVFHWETMSSLEINDIVFNYCKGFILGYSVVTSFPYLTEKPNEFTQGVYWEAEGRMVDVEYNEFENKLLLKDIFDKIKDFLTLKHSPIVRGSVKANQGYLYKISDEFGEVILRIANVSSINTFQVTASNGESKDIKNNIPDVTSRRGLVTSRVGQGDYRRRLLQRWNNKCAVTDCTIIEILIASHIKPWSESDDFERLDVDNGILLSPKYDALFDKHLISFSDSGEIIISDKITPNNFQKLKLTGQERIKNLTEGSKKYLAYHRNRIK